MNRKFIPAIAIIGVIVACGSAWGRRQVDSSRHHITARLAPHTDEDYAALSGLGRIRVEINTPIIRAKIDASGADPYSQFDRIGEDAMRTNTELELRIAGVPFDSAAPDDWNTLLHSSLHEFRVHSVPTLVVSVDEPIEGGLGIFNVTLMLVEEASLVRNPRVSANTITWREYAVGRTIQDATKQAVDKFANSYLRMNPKK